MNAPANSSVTYDPDELASVLERLGHHRVGQHGQDRARREGQDEGDHLRSGVLEEAVAGQRGEPRDQGDPDPHPEDARLLPSAGEESGARGDRFGQVGDEDRGR